MRRFMVIVISLFQLNAYSDSTRKVLKTFDPPLDAKEISIASSKAESGYHVLSIAEDAKIRGIFCTKKMELRVSTSNGNAVLVSPNSSDKDIYCLYDNRKASEIIINKKFQPMGANLFFSGHSFEFDENSDHLKEAKKHLKQFTLDNKKYYLVSESNQRFDLNFKIMLLEPATLKGIKVDKGSIIYFNRVYIEGKDSNDLYIQMIWPPLGKTIKVASQECDLVGFEQDFSLEECVISKALVIEGIIIPKGSEVSFGKNEFGKTKPELIKSLSEDVVAKGKVIKAGVGSWAILNGELKATEK